MLVVLCPVKSAIRTLQINEGYWDGHSFGLLEALQKSDGGPAYPIGLLEATTLETPRGSFTIYCDEDGLQHFSKENLFDIYGPFLITGNVDEEGNETGLTQEEADYLLEYSNLRLAQKK